MKLRQRDPLLLLTIGVALEAAVGLQIARDRQYPRDERASADLLYVRSGEV